MVATAEFVREHLQALAIGSELTRWFRKDREPQVLHVTPENVIAALHKAGINPVLMGDARHQCLPRPGPLDAGRGRACDEARRAQGGARVRRGLPVS
jgi:hypothetical protein